jgi:hypothetical protein
MAANPLPHGNPVRKEPLFTRVQHAPGQAMEVHAPLDASKDPTRPNSLLSTRPILALREGRAEPRGVTSQGHSQWCSACKRATSDIESRANGPLSDHTPYQELDGVQCTDSQLVGTVIDESC